MLNQLESSILATLVWFDLFDWPLTIEEVQRYLWSGNRYLTNQLQTDYTCPLSFLSSYQNFNNFRANLHRVLRKSASINFKDGFYFLQGREELILIRKEREKIVSRRLKRAKWIARLLGSLPWVKMVGLGNIMGEGNFKEEGDLDLFIITSKDRIWTTRFFVVSLTEILNLRPKKNKRKDKICLSFFITEDNLNLESIALKPYDIYLPYWIYFLIPLYECRLDRVLFRETTKDLIAGTEEIFSKFLKANEWIRKFLPNAYQLGSEKARKPGSEEAGKRGSREARKPGSMNFVNLQFVEDFLSKIEKFFHWIQLKIMPKDLREKAKTNPQAIIISDKILKLHEKERREEYRRRFETKLLNVLTRTHAEGTRNNTRKRRGKCAKYLLY